MNALSLSATAALVSLRRVLLADAVVSGAAGVLLLLAAAPLDGLLGLPESLLRLAGLAMLPWAVALTSLARRQRPSQPWTLAVVGINVLWVLGSGLLLMTGWVDPTGPGYAFVIAQTLAVALFADLQYLGLRNAAPAPA